jgi:hypothetical protein
MIDNIKMIYILCLVQPRLTVMRAIFYWYFQKAQHKIQITENRKETHWCFLILNHEQCDHKEVCVCVCVFFIYVHFCFPCFHTRWSVTQSVA